MSPDDRSVLSVTPQVSERTLVFLVGAVQFVNILDFMMVMPLGPDFAAALGISASKLGFIGGSYTAAAALAGLVGSLFLDRFDRRKALALSMLGLVLGTAAGGFSRGLGSLMVARILAGLFGGPATSLSLSIIADVIPPERRGKAMGSVMGAFSVASVLGVPAGLELARLGSWRLPFFGVAALGLVLTAAAFVLLPPLTIHLAQRVPHAHLSARDFTDMLGKRAVQLSYAMSATAMMGGFILIPNISAYSQFNVGYPREHLGRLYLIGGMVSFATMRIAGAMVDRYGPTLVALPGTVIQVLTIYLGFVVFPPPIPWLMMFVLFMTASSFRNVAFNTMTSRVPLPHERARFMSIQSAVQHFASATGAFLSAQLLRELPGSHSLTGMPIVAGISIALMAMLPALMKLVESQVRDRASVPSTAMAHHP